MFHSKEDTPQNTVSRARKIIRDLGLDVEESDLQESSAHTYSMVLRIGGTNFATNGKGITRDLACASAYGEMMERLQNDALWPRMDYSDVAGFCFSPDERWMSASDILKVHSKFLSVYRQSLRADFELTPEQFSDLHIYDWLQYDKQDSFLCIPFENKTNHSVEYLPKCLYTYFYGTNGMCAGNTPEEAQLQGLAEILERAAQRKLLTEKPILPDIPEEELQKYPEVMERIAVLRQKPGMRLSIKDCTFGGRLPGVVGIFFILEGTGKFGFKLGCHPRLEIALERVLTEAAQGQEYEEYAKRSQFSFFDSNVYEPWNLRNLFRTGHGDYPYRLLKPSPSWTGAGWRTPGQTNGQWLSSWQDELEKQGFEILVRDNSFLGFPAYHIIIPGLSELDYPDETQFRFLHTRKYLSLKLQGHLEEMTQEDFLLLRQVLEHFREEQFEGSAPSYYFSESPEDFPGWTSGLSCDYMMAMCDIAIGQEDAAVARLQMLAEAVAEKESPWLKCLTLWLEGRQNNLPPAEISSYLEMLFPTGMVRRIETLFADPQKILLSQYPNRSEREQLRSMPRFLKALKALKQKQKEFYIK